MLLTTLFSVAALVAVGHTAPVEKRQGPAGVPDFVTKYAPVVYLHSKEQWFPTDLQTFLTNTVPQVAWKTISGPNPLTLDNVNQLGDNVWLTSKDDITKNPAWLKGTKPDGNGKTNDAITASVIVNDKGNGIVDAFYMYFYAYNYGGNVLGIKKLNFGNHVGDFEHNMIRFENGVPQWIWYSQHGNGQAFRYTTAQKHAGGPRPIVYSSSGSHANYAIPGKHDHLIPNFNLPGGALEDDTNAGTLWDPLLSAYWYSYNAGKGEFTPYDASGKTPVNWLYFKGKWGDEEYQKGDKRQVKLFGHAKFSGGPTGPANKQLDRKEVCPQNGNKCILRTILVPRRVGDEEDEEV